MITQKHKKKTVYCIVDLKRKTQPAATPSPMPTFHNYTTYYNAGILDILCNNPNICSIVNTSYVGGTML